MIIASPRRTLAAGAVLVRGIVVPSAHDIDAMSDADRATLHQTFVRHGVTPALVERARDAERCRYIEALHHQLA